MTKNSNYNPAADARWNEKNKAHRNYLTKRSHARGFIKNSATLEDLEELIQLIETRKEELKE